MPRRPIDPELHRFLDQQAAIPTAPVRHAAEARSRMAAALQARTIPGLPNDVQASDSFIPAVEGPGTRVRVYVPPTASATPLPVLVYLHGGGWVAGSIETHDPFCRLLAPLAHLSIVSVEYQLAPEAPYPAALSNVQSALAWTATHASTWNGDPARVALGGDSAGANLAAVIANRLAVQRAETPPIQALLLLYPATDHYSATHASWAENASGCGLDADTMRWYWDQYTAGASPDDPDLSPLRSLVVLPLPPTLVATAEYDVLRDEGIAYARKLQQGGVAVTHLHSPVMHHNFPVGPATVARFPQCDGALAQCAAWLRARFAQ